MGVDGTDGRYLASRMTTFDYDARIEKCRRAMAVRGVDAMLLSIGADLPYLIGYEATPLERLTMLILTGSDATLIVPELEEPRVGPGPARVVAWPDGTNPISIVANLVGAASHIALGDKTWSTFLLALQQASPGVSWSLASGITGPLRQVKDKAEIEALAAAGAAADRVAARLGTEVDFEGMSETVLARRVAEMVVAEGHDLAWDPIVASGPNGASPHHEPGERVIERGDLVVIDFGGRVSGYYSDTTRTFAVGEPTAEQKEIYEVVRAANQAGRDAVRPGVAAEEIDRASRSLIDDAGYGAYFIHRTGHGIGLEVHEHPYIVESNNQTLEPGMAFSVEPGIYLPGRFGVRIEDIVVVTDDGARDLNAFNRGLVVVG